MVSSIRQHGVGGIYASMAGSDWKAFSVSGSEIKPGYQHYSGVRLGLPSSKSVVDGDVADPSTGRDVIAYLFGG